MHTHSSFSDGSCTPEELIEASDMHGIGAIALCDHNNVDGLYRFQKAAAGTSVTAVPGVEITSEYSGKEVHILGLFISPAHQARLTDYLEEINRRKEKANKDLARRLKSGGYKIDYESIKSTNSAKVPNRVHFAKALMENGYVKSIPEAFKELLRDGGAFYKSAEKFNACDVISFLKSIDALPVMAHPLMSLSENEVVEFLPKAKNYGLVGIEAIYSTFGPKETDFLSGLAQKHSLIISGGSDYHGKNRPNTELGHGKNNIPIPYGIYENLRKEKER